MTALLSAITVAIGHVSRRSGDFITGFTKLLLQKVVSDRLEEEPGQSPISYVFADLPSTVRSTFSSISLDGQTTQYAVCAQCNCTYGPKVDRRSRRTIYPDTCSNKSFPGAGVCGSQMRDPDNKLKKTFLYYEFKDYLAALFSRSDLETYLDNSADKFTAAYAARHTFDSSDHVTDVFEGDFFRNFTVPGDTPGTFVPFLTRKGNDSRLIFSLHVDFFNVDRMLIRGSSSSRGTIAMACLNLPPDIRYKAENIYLAGIIPGPSEPSLTEFNHFIKPLVDDLVVAFNPGIFLTTTSLHRSGRHIRCAIGPIVCDLPAGRKLLQLTAHNSNNYCPACTQFGKSTWGDSDYPWPERNAAEMRLAAEQWRIANSTKVANHITEKFGVRYTELWRLSYLNPVKQLVVSTLR